MKKAVCKIPPSRYYVNKYRNEMLNQTIKIFTPERERETETAKERKKEDDRVYTSVVPSSETTDRMAQNSLATATMAPRSLPASHPTHTALLPGLRCAMGP